MRTLLALALLSIASCAAPRREAPERYWVWIRTGPKDAELQGPERDAAFVGHFSNMARLAEEGSLLVAGPFGEPRAEPDQRGVFVLAAPDLGAARALAETDPTAEAGVFVLDVEPFHSGDPLERVNELHAAAVARAGVENPSPGFHCRPYVLVAGVPAADAERALDGRGLPVLFAGRLGENDAERALFCLDARSAEAAQTLLAAAAADGVTWAVMPWFASEEVAHLRAARD